MIWIGKSNNNFREKTFIELMKMSILRRTTVSKNVSSLFGAHTQTLPYKSLKYVRLQWWGCGELVFEIENKANCRVKIMCLLNTK